MSRARLPQAPVAALTLTSFLLSLFAPCGSSASSGDESTAEVESVPVPAASLPSAGASATANANPGDPKAPEVLMSDQPKEISVSTEAPPIAPSVSKPIETVALPSGADKSGVTSKSISVPKGAGTIQGMEESFSAQLSTGIATFSVPIALPAARGGAQPSLGLSYSSSGGSGVVGMGWSIGVPFIARQTDRGVPRYDDPGKSQK